MTGSTTKINRIQRSTNIKNLKVLLKKQPAPKTTKNNREKKVETKNNKVQTIHEASLSDDILHHYRQRKFSEESQRRITEGITKGINKGFEELKEGITKGINKGFEELKEGIKKGFVELAEEIKKGLQMHIALQETKELEADIDKVVAMDMSSDINISGL